MATKPTINRQGGGKVYPTGGGFTLLELMVVISMTAALLALLVPALGTAQDSTRTVKCANNLKQMVITTHSYAQVNTFLPPSWIGQANPQHWTALLTEHVNGVRLTYDESGTPLGVNLPIFECPDANVPDTGPSLRRTHYSAHQVLMPRRHISGKWTGQMYRPERIQRQGEVILMADGVQTDEPGDRGNTGHAYPSFKNIIELVTNGEDSHPKYYDINDGDNGDPIDEGDFPNVDAKQYRGYIRYRHQGDGSANVGYVDGHVSTIKRGEIRRLNIRTNP